MLSSLHIENFAVIEELEIEFASGLNVITGETGAGKSIILGALQLLLGDRADKTLIRAGAQGSEIRGVFHLETTPSVLGKINEILQESGTPSCEEGQLIIARKLGVKTTKNYVNSAPITLNLLQALGELLVDVHGPYDHQSLTKPGTQLELLDSFANLLPNREKTRENFQKLNAIRQEIYKIENEGFSPDRIDIMRFQLNEIKHAAIKDGEDEELNVRHASAANRQEILEILDQSLQSLNADDGVLNHLAGIMRNLGRMQHLDPNLAPEFMSSLENIHENINEFCHDLNSYVEKIDIDPAAFMEMEARLALIQKLKQKYGGSVNTINAYAEKIGHDLSQIENKDHHLEELKKEENETKTAFLNQARLLSEGRHRHASKLGKIITEKVKYLGFKDCQFFVKLDETTMNSKGIDAVTFQFSPNPGEGTKPLRDIASAGEMSRVMLAIKTILANADQIPVLVFDEIDVNIGGVVATKVGSELAKLGKGHQILSITHLPQVAVEADRHLFIKKSTANGRTKTTLTVLTNENRVQEIARMLGGQESTSVTLKHAAELLKKH